MFAFFYIKMSRQYSYGWHFFFLLVCVLNLLGGREGGRGGRERSIYHFPGTVSKMGPPQWQVKVKVRLG